MSQVKIQGGASGSDNYTILAPATSTGDKTLTLPTATATLASTDANTFTGVQTFPAGSASAPSITTTGDTNTGVYFSAADEISFATGGSQRVKIGTADLTITNGNLVIGTSGKGIDFSATAGTGTSELLSDYEEGTWTPAIAGGVTSPVLTVNYGSYIKIGKQVTVYCLFTLSGTTNSAQFKVSGLPFATSAAGNNYPPGGATTYAQLSTTASYPWAGASSTTVDFYQTATTGPSNFTLASSPSGGYFGFFFTYLSS